MMPDMRLILILSLVVLGLVGSNSSPSANAAGEASEGGVSVY